MDQYRWLVITNDESQAVSPDKFHTRYHINVSYSRWENFFFQQLHILSNNDNGDDDGGGGGRDSVKSNILKVCQCYTEDEDINIIMQRLF